MNVTHLALRVPGYSRRVLARPFIPGSRARLGAIVDRVHALSNEEARAALATVLADYRPRHKDIRGIFRQNCATVLAIVGGHADLDDEHRMLAGAYFTSEYSLEAAALFNPSMVRHPDQDGLPTGATRFVMSLRACGEGHISSIEFCAGVVNAACDVTLEPRTPYAMTARTLDDTRYHKKTYLQKLIEMGGHSTWVEPVLEHLDEHFTMSDLKDAIEKLRPKHAAQTPYREATDNMVWLAGSNYELVFSPDSELSERVIFPVSENESRGIEDARFVCFKHTDGRAAYYATYTAYNGFRVLPQLIETIDFRHFKTSTLNGRCVQNKGMALFPRKIGSDYVMAARPDGESIYVLRSDNLHFWNESKLVHAPKYPWEFIQVGNCGSPIETEKGWVLLTHGVGPMRQYWIGALLLDLEDPSRVIGQLAEPLLMPDPAERDGYVPNVVYSCGGMQHGDRFVIPYAVGDARIAIATVPMAELLASFT